MKQYATNQIKNIALFGHGGSGKTTLADALLFSFGAIERIGCIEDGTTVMDFDPEEKKRAASVYTAVYPIDLQDYKVNLIDTPGQFDFAGEAVGGLAACDGAVVVISGKSGLTVGALQSFERAREAGKPVAFFIGKLNSSHAHFYRVVSALTAHYGAVVCPVIVPLVENETVTAYWNLIENKAYKCEGKQLKETVFEPTTEAKGMRDLMLEAVASTDEGLMEKYFDGQPFSEEEIVMALKKGVQSGDICPVVCGVQATGDAIPMSGRVLFDLMPDASVCKVTVEKDGEAQPCVFGADEPSLFVFKTVADPFVGKLSYFKVVTGAVKSDTRLKNARTGNEERLSKVMMICGHAQQEVTELVAGDIGCVAKLGDVKTGDTLSVKEGAVVMPAYPAPSLSMAVYPKNKGEDEKAAAGINRIAEEDPTISFTYRKETGESVLSGLGEQHMDVVVSRLKAKFGVEVVLTKPKVAYRETIRKTAKVQGRYKKQSGGHGQFGDVWIQFEPCDSEELVFEEKVVGGAVPKNFFPAVEKGLRESVVRGVLAGYPMVGIKATLYDGSYHPVDSSEASFKTAASLAFKEGVPQCAPVLLEPFGKLCVTAPDEMLGDVIGEINKRRGRIVGMNPLPGKRQEVIGEAPFAEMADFSTAMRSITGGTAVFAMTFERYEEVPDAMAQKIIDEQKTE